MVLRASPGDHHVVLGLPRGASLSEIKAAFLAKTRATHPDKTGEQERSSAAFARVKEAAVTLQRWASIA